MYGWKGCPQLGPDGNTLLEFTRRTFLESLAPPAIGAVLLAVAIRAVSQGVAVQAFMTNRPFHRIRSMPIRQQALPSSKA